MTRYAVIIESFEYNCQKYKTPEEAWSNQTDYDGKTIGTYDTHPEALTVLKSDEVQKTLDNTQFSYKLARSNVAYIEEGEYDLNDDGEWEFVSGGNVYDFSYYGKATQTTRTMEEYEKLIAEQKADSTHGEDTPDKTKMKSDKSIEK